MPKPQPAAGGEGAATRDAASASPETLAGYAAGGGGSGK